MKRHPYFTDFSHEHHHTLALCLRILRTPNADHRTEITEHWAHLSQHFQSEEQRLAPLWDSLNRLELQHRFIGEHQQLTDLWHNAEFENPQWNQKFATLLREHIRFEERELFPAIETLLPHE